ncbi:immunity repressor [Gordonia phage JuJu]|uniref:Immunity repressor n=1 Tax=Gordonia phage JuJu TaxID=2590929 RepID=A0A516KRA0_9CAUD|nr:immunity repressor [Gordonia phage JuJu]QDP44163.1 immunity repressor [Gordonia phage JuJu]
MSELWEIIQTHLDQTGVREAEFARRIGTSPTTVNSWKNRGVRSLPERRLLQAVADEIDGVKYRDVLAAVLTDIGYADPSLATGRRHHGAWELGPELMVRLAMEAKGVESDAWTASLLTDDDDIDEIISTTEELTRSAEELAETAQEVAKLGVGGAAYLELAVEEERKRRRAVREASRSVGRRLSRPRSVARPSSSEAEVRPDDGGLPAAARQGLDKTKGEKLRDAHSDLGEESQVGLNDDDV